MTYDSIAKNVLSSILAQLLAGLSLAFFFLLGYFWQPAFALVFFLIFTATLLFVFVLGLVLAKKRGKQLSTMRAEEINTFLCERREEVARRTDEAAEELRRVVRKTQTFLCLEMLLMYASSLFLGALGITALWLVLLLYYFAAVGVYLRLFAALLYRSAVSLENILPRKDFPGLYALAERAADTLDVRGELLLTTDDSFSASIAKVGGKHLVLLGACLVAALSEEELYNVLLHEMAHVSPRYTPGAVSDFYHRFMDFEPSTGITFKFFVVYPQARYYEENLLYTLLASAAVEGLADAVVLEKGDPAAFASALAKTAFALSYERVAYAYLKALPYSSETMEKDPVTRKFEAYLTAVKERADMWLERYEREIRPRNATHPIYRERRDAVGVAKEDVFISFDLADDPLREERARLLAFADGQLEKAITPHYKELRKQMVLVPEKTVADYEKNKECYATHALTPVIDALISLARRDEAERLCDEIIANETNRYATAYARFFKGYLRLCDDDPAGIPLLYEAAELNESLTQTCYEQIGEFACLYGLEKELEDYRARALVLAQKLMDESGASDTLTSSDELSSDPMEKEKQEAIVSFAIKMAPEISAIYLARKTVSEECFVHALVLEFAKKTDFEKIRDVFEQLNRYLDALDGERYSLFYAAPQIKRIIRRVEGALIYSSNR